MRGQAAAPNAPLDMKFRNIVLTTLCLALTAGAVAATADYHLAKTFVLGGDGGWDYLTYDSGTKRLFVSRATRVMVVDPEAGKVTGEIPDTPGVHGIALAPDLGRGFTSNGADGTVTVFNLASLTKIATVKTGAKNPDGIVYDSATKRIYTFNGGSDDATAIDARTNTVVGTVPLGGRPEFPADDGHGIIYDNIESTSEIVKIDAAKAAIVSRFALGACRNPSGLSMDVSHRRLFTACSGEMGVVDADTGKVLATVPTGAGTDATRYDAASGLAFASNGRDGTLTIVGEDGAGRFTLVQNATTAPGARTMELDPTNGTVYLVSAKLIDNPNATSYHDRHAVVPGTFELLVMRSSS